MDTVPPAILLVDDEEKFLKSFSERIRLRGFEPIAVGSGEEALVVVKKTKIDLAIVDYKMQGMDGVATITKLKEIQPGIQTVLLTGYGDKKLQEVVEALDSAYFEKDQMRSFWEFLRHFKSKNGFIIIQPPNSRDAEGEAFDAGSSLWGLKGEEIELFAAKQAMDRRQPLAEAAVRPAAYPAIQQPQRLVGETPAVQALKKSIRKVAVLDCTVLIIGESGTGKELAARTIHGLSHRRDQKFSAVNCGGLNEALLSSELFGRQPDAFTSAYYRHKGVLEAAAGGSILLDGIDETTVSLQLKLLRVLERKTVIPVGGTEEIPLNVRLMAAADQTLEEKIEAGRFREDLYYRLNAFTLVIPPLRERRDDIPLLCRYFLDKYSREFGKTIQRISDNTLSVFMTYPFPGNVRELENCIERAVIMCEGTEVKRRHLPDRFQTESPIQPVQKKRFVTLAQLEAQYIQEVLANTKGNKSEAARILGINRASLWRKLKSLEEAT